MCSEKLAGIRSRLFPSLPLFPLSHMNPKELSFTSGTSSNEPGSDFCGTPKSHETGKLPTASEGPHHRISTPALQNVSSKPQANLSRSFKKFLSCLQPGKIQRIMAPTKPKRIRQTTAPTKPKRRSGGVNLIVRDVPRLDPHLCHMGLGPISSPWWPISLRYPTRNTLKDSRFGLNFLMSHPSEPLSRLLELADRRRRLEPSQTMFLCWYKLLMRTWLLELPKDSILFRNLTLEIPNPIYHQFNLEFVLRLLGNSDYKLCVEFLKLHCHWLHAREDTPALLQCCIYLCNYTLIETPTTFFNQLPKGCKLGLLSLSQGSTDYKLCMDLLNLQGHWLHGREDSPAMLRFCTSYLCFPKLASSNAKSYEPTSLKILGFLVMILIILADTQILVSLMEHPSKSLVAYFAHSDYDHKLIKEVAKLFFMVDSTMVSKDFSNCTPLENSCNHYLYPSCYVLTFDCLNFPLLRL